MTGNGTPPNQTAEKNLGEIVSEVSEKASMLIRQEIDLAKAEMTDKATKLARGAGIGAAAGVFLVFGVTMFFFALAFFLNDLLNQEDNIWFGFAIVTAFLFLLAIIAGLVAMRLFKKGAPPTPDMAIEEAKKTRSQFEAQKIERDQLERSTS
jgi:H+/Cl- antiporter ClcA